MTTPLDPLVFPQSASLSLASVRYGAKILSRHSTRKETCVVIILLHIPVVLISERQIGIRYGHFYAYTLIDHLEPKLDMDDGIVRISLVHYNTIEEVERIIGVLNEILA